MSWHSWRFSQKQMAISLFVIPEINKPSRTASSNRVLARAHTHTHECIQLSIQKEYPSSSDIQASECEIPPHLTLSFSKGSSKSSLSRLKGVMMYDHVQTLFFQTEVKWCVHVLKWPKVSTRRGVLKLLLIALCKIQTPDRCKSTWFTNYIFQLDKASQCHTSKSFDGWQS